MPAANRPHFLVKRATTAVLQIAVLTVILCHATPTLGQGGTAPDPSEFLANRDGLLVNFEEGPIHPLELDAAGDELWVASIPHGEVRVLDVSQPAAPTVKADIAVGLGPVAIRRRPVGLPVQPYPGTPPTTQPAGKLGSPSGTDTEIEFQPTARPEMWVVCQSSNSVFVIDQQSKQVTGSIRLAHEPADLVFSADGTTAYVSLAASHQVAKIDAVSRQVTATMEVETAMSMLPSSGLYHVDEPRSLALDSGQLYVLSFQSGNGSSGLGVPFANPDFPGSSNDPLLTNLLPLNTVLILDLWSIYDNGLPLFPGTSFPPPPDRDIVQLDPANPTAAGTVALWRAGTMNYDLLLDDGTFYVSNVDFVNANFDASGSLADTMIGEFEFVDQGIVRHRITIAPPTPLGTSAPQHQTIDLNQDLGAGLSGVRCATPNEMVLAEDGKALWVACYETRTVAKVDLDPASPDQHKVVAALVGPASGEGFGPRGLAFDESAGVMYVYNRGDNTVQVFDSLPTAGSTALPVTTVAAGFDITPLAVREGRRHFIDAANSATGQLTCNTCHPDGHLDGLAWDLSDFTGDLDLAPVARTPKGAKVTMSLRGIEETPPFHWRGDRADLQNFDPAFAGLLGGSQLGPQGSKLDELLAFVFSLSYPPNPHQADDRSLDGNELLGLEAFSVPAAHDITLSGARDDDDMLTDLLDVSCEQCHRRTGGSGTNNQVNNDAIALLADDATQLRGMFDKETDIVDYTGTAFDLEPLTLLNAQPASGWGFANTGFADNILGFVNLGVVPTSPGGVFNGLSTTEKQQVADFLAQWDSGVAPTTARAWTISAATVGSGAAEIALLMQQADAGDNELVVRGWLRINGQRRSIGMLYQPGNGSGNGIFVPNISSQPNFTLADLQNRAQNNNGVFTLVGTPVGSGYRLGLDRDMDFLLDGDERTTQTDNPDSDGDGFPDGYEKRLGTNPALFSSQPLPADDLQVAQAHNEISVWVNSRVAKLRWDTDEESITQVKVRQTGHSAVIFEATDLQFKKEHVVVVRNLQPNKSYTATIETRDPNGNFDATTTLAIQNTGPELVEATFVAKSQLEVLSVIGTNFQLRATFDLVDKHGAPVVGSAVAFNLIEWIDGTACPIADCTTTPAVSGVTNAQGRVVYDFPAQLQTTDIPSGQQAFAEVYVRSFGLDNDASSSHQDLHYFHPLDGQFGHWACLELQAGQVSVIGQGCS